MNWFKALPQNELAEGEKRRITLNGQVILLLKHDNKIYAVSNKCPHLNLPLQKGKITQEGTIVCPWHHSEFDLVSGDVKAWSPWPPVVGKMLGCLSRQKALPTFQTKIETGDIWVLINSTA